MNIKIGKKTYPVHPLCGLFPWMDEKVFDALKKDMTAHGQRDTIKIFQGKVLDGKNRLRACKELELEPRTEELPEDIDIHAYIKAVGLCRRDLTPDQRIDIATEIEEMRQEQEGKKKKIEELKKDPKQKALIEANENKRIAQEANSNVKTVEQYREIKEKATRDKDAEEELKKIKEGKTSIKRAHRKVTPKAEKDESEKPKKPSKKEVEEELMEVKREKVSLENRFKRVMEILKKHEVWEIVKKELYPILEEVKPIQPTIREMREAELI